jgi:gluconate 2-dehydrogenase gamma chain
VKPELRHGATFFSRFRDMTAAGFFSSPTGWKDLRYLGNVFNPNWNGCPEPAMQKLGVSHALMDTRVASQVSER